MRRLQIETLQTLEWADSFCCALREDPLNINHGKLKLWTHFPNRGKFHYILDRKSPLFR